MKGLVSTIDDRPQDESDYPYGPDVSNIYFSKTFPVTDTSDSKWFGLYNENLTLGSGTYWVAFEVRSPELISTAITQTPWVYDPNQPYLPNYYAFNSEGKVAPYNGYGGCTPFALRIGDESQPSAAAEPATMLLLCLGLVGLAGVRRFKK